MRQVELLAPAGDPQKLMTAIDYGADAVYCGGEEFGLRTSAGNFTPEQLSLGVDYAHKSGKKVYLALNIFAHNEDIDHLNEYLSRLAKIPLDAFIVADPGVMAMVREQFPDAGIHLSTQANTTNWKAASYWHTLGVNRIVLARELSLHEITQMRQKAPQALELEGFVHGAMCISYSGRCLISNFLTGRDANRGECTHPCRWKYTLMEEKRPGEYFPVVEGDRGSYIMNSRDLCMIMHLPDLIQAGINSLKIEGRTKSAFYVATVVGAYRKALDSYYRDPDNYGVRPEWLEEVGKVSHRMFTTVFYYGRPGEEDQNYNSSQYVREYTFLGIIKAYDPVEGVACIEQKNKIRKGDAVEIIGPGGVCFHQTIDNMLDEEGNPIQEAPHPGQIVLIRTNEPVGENFMVRKKE